MYWDKFCRLTRQQMLYRHLGTCMDNHSSEKKEPVMWVSKIIALLPNQSHGQATKLPFDCPDLSFPLYFNIFVICSSHQLWIPWTPCFLSLHVFILLSECKTHSPNNCTIKQVACYTLSWFDRWKLSQNLSCWLCLNLEHWSLEALKI